MKRSVTALLVCLCAILLIATTAQARTWQYEYPVSSGGVAGLWASIAKDSSGVVHVAYIGHGKLMYATRDASWSAEVVNATGISSGESARWTSLAISGTTPHIAYYDARTRTLKHATKSGGQWSTATVDTNAGTGKHTSIAVNASGYPAITYYDEENDRLRYAYKDGSGWHFSTVATGCGQHNSLKFDGSGNAHVAYYDYTEVLKYAKRSGGTWTYETADSGRSCGEMCSIALDSSGNPRIAYRDGFTGRLRYAWRDGSGWHVDVADSLDRTGFQASLAIGTDGYPRICYYRLAGYTDGYNWYAFETKYAYKDGSGWHTQTIQRIQSTTEQWCMSMVLDSSNRPCVAYHYFGSKSLNYMYYNGGSWPQETADSGRELGQYASLVLDGSDNPHISYYAMDWPDLFYAWKSGGSWSAEQVDSSGDTGGYSSIALLPTGYPAIAYGRFLTSWNSGQASVTSDLKYAYKDGSGWHPSLVQSSTGRFTSLAIYGGYPRISYCDMAYRGESLKYAEWNGSNWSIATADSGSSPDPTTGSWHADGFWSDIAFDASGNPHISYMEHYEQYTSNPETYVLLRQLRHAWRSGGTWYSEVVDPNHCGSFTSIAVDSSGYPHIAYVDVAHGYLRYARKSAGGWTLETIDTTWATGWYASLVLDSSGYPHIAYKDIKNQVLRYAWKDGTGWHTETVDNSCRAGDYCSLRLTSSGNPYIAYMDWDSLTLKVAYPGSSEVGAISGYVKDTSNNPISGATIATTSGGYTTTSAADGSYTLSNVAAGTYSVTASKTGYNPQTQTGVSVSVGQTTTCNFSLTQIQLGAISGYVRDAASNPIGGATVATSSGGYSTTSAADGSYTLSNVTPATYNVTASKAGCTSDTEYNVIVTSGQTTTVNFTLTGTGEDIGALVNASFENSWTYRAGGVPSPPGAWFLAGWAATSGGPQYYTGAELSNGRPSDHRCKWEFNGGGVGGNNVIAKEINWGSYSSVTVTVWCAGRTWGGTNGSMRLGIDTDGAGTQWTDCGSNTVSRTSNDQSWAQLSKTISKPAGAMTFTVMLNAVPSGTSWNCQFDKLEITGAQQPGTISGYVKDTSNNAISGATVSTNTGGYTTTSAADGSYTLSNVVPGTYDVTASKTGYQSQTQTGKAVTSGQTTTVNFTLTPSQTTIASEDFETMPSWSSSYNATWGSAATWSIVTGGQSGNCLQASRTSNGSSVKAKVYTVPQNTSITISVYIKCPSYGGAYWIETGYRLGSYTAENFDQDAGNWTLIKKFSDGGTNGNGNVWTQYSTTVNTGANTQISIGYKHGAWGCTGPTVQWDTFRIQ